MQLPVLKISGKEAGRNVTLSKSVFDIEPNDHAVYLDVRLYRANQRQGNSKTKQRSEIKGSTRKIKKQKGTGTARAGSIKSPIFRGGGTAFGPQPRDYGFKLNKKIIRLAKKSVFSYKAKEKSIAVIEEFKMDEPKTGEYMKILNNLSLADKKTLLILPENNGNIFLSGRNLQKAKITTVNELNTYDLLNADNLLISESSVKKIEENLK